MTQAKTTKQPKERLLIELLRVVSKSDEEFDNGQGLFDLDLIRYITDLNRKAVNERQALLEHLENCVELLKWCGSSLTDQGKNTVKEANIFLYNAKLIKP